MHLAVLVLSALLALSYVRKAEALYDASDSIDTSFTVEDERIAEIDTQVRSINARLQDFKLPRTERKKLTAEKKRLTEEKNQIREKHRWRQQEEAKKRAQQEW